MALMDRASISVGRVFICSARVDTYLVFFSFLSCLIMQSSLLSVQEHHNRRMAKLREMIEDRRRLVEDHESGERRLGQEDFDRTARQLRNFQRKLDRMEETNNVVSLFGSVKLQITERFCAFRACLYFIFSSFLPSLFLFLCRRVTWRGWKK